MTERTAPPGQEVAIAAETSADKGLRPKASGTRIYFVASLVAPAAALLRNIVIARMLGPEMFGLAVTLIVTGQFFDTVTNIGSDQFLVQDDDGETPKVQAMAQLTMVIRGIFSAAMMVAVATPVAYFYHQPQLGVPLMLMGLIPLCAAFSHLDIRRYQRQHKFAPESRALIVSELSSLGVAVVLAVWLHHHHATLGYYAALGALLARTAILVLMTHIVAERRYQLSYEAKSAGKMVRFGWPLLLNGGLLFFGGQGDRILIGHFMGPTALGLYSTALLLIFYPATVAQRFLSNIHFPQLVAARKAHAGMVQAEGRLKGDIMVVGVLAAIGFVMVAPIALYHLYGPRFAQAPMLVGLIGVLQCTRMLRVWPATIALAMGRTGIILSSNIVRMIALPLAWLGYTLGYGLIGLTLGMILGEVISIMSSLWPFASSRGRQFRAIAMTTLILAATLAEVVSLALMMSHGLSIERATGAVGAAALLALLLVTDTPLVATLRGLMTTLRTRKSTSAAK
ncbi:MAG: oligosaccharide flippase family protein [Sphingomonas sp.]